MHRRSRLILILTLGALVVGGLAWVALRPVPATVETAAVVRAPMEVTVDVDGRTRIREVWEVAAPIAGTALRSPVRVGDPVVAGETLVAVVRPIAPSLLDARSRSQAEAAVRQAEAALRVAQGQLHQARDDEAYARSQYDRVQALVERGVAPTARLDDAGQVLALKEAARETAQSGLSMAMGALEGAQAALIGPDAGGATAASCCVEIRAPVTGAVLAIDRVSERPVAAGERLLSLGDPGDLEIVAEPLSRDAVGIPAGATARVERWGGPGELQARLRRIEPRAVTEVSALGIEEQRVEALFDIATPAAERAGLGDGYALRLRIAVWSSPAALQVPLGALFRQGDDWAVFAVREGRARLRPVRIGHRTDRTAEVLGGLSEGDRVVAHPGADVEDGAPVTDAVPEPVATPSAAEVAAAE